MKFVEVAKMITFHPMVVLWSALWTSIVAVVGSGMTVHQAYHSNAFTLGGYWVVSAAVVTIAFALTRALKGQEAADGAPALGRRIRAKLR